MPRRARPGSQTIAESRVHAKDFPGRGAAERAAFPGCFAAAPATLVGRTITAARPALRLASHLLEGILDLLAPSTCHHCNALTGPGGPLCDACSAQVRWLDVACRHCGAPLRASQPADVRPPRATARRRSALPRRRCAHCAGRRWAFERALAAAEYSGTLRRVVLDHKFRGDAACLEFLAAAVVSKMRREARDGFHVGPGWTVTAVPQHWLKTVRRGRDPGQLLARRVAAELRCPYRRLLRKSRWTPPQVTLAQTARRQNLKAAFRAVRRGTMPRRIILVDDVLTTGTTASRCAAALQRAGARRVIVLTVARA